MRLILLPCRDVAGRKNYKFCGGTLCLANKSYIAKRVLDSPFSSRQGSPNAIPGKKTQVLISYPFKNNLVILFLLWEQPSQDWPIGILPEILRLPMNGNLLEKLHGCRSDTKRDIFGFSVGLE